ncbi:Nramp family divalent metal transporter [Solirubrobacter taibaiensis]|nr:Nramp family divalent metal transporter [Solirubrobacter taibaiensis]
MTPSTPTMLEPRTAPASAPNAPAAEAEIPVPHNFAGYIKGMGPGIVVALSWLGTGDLINSSVSGANYGYVLMWALVIATLARYFVVSALTKYQLCNSTGDNTILDGFERVWRGFPMFLGICSVALGIVYHCFLFLGAGTALFYLFGEFGGQWGVFMWALVVLAAVVFMASRPNEYKWLEHTANFAMATLVLIFIWALIGSGIDVGAFFQGLTFSMPEDRGAYGAWLVVVAIIGAVGGSVANLMYPYFVADKGWKGPKYRKLQVYDLLFGVCTLIVLNIAIWVVAAELMRGQGATIDGPEDLARMMELAIGPAGPPLLWIAIFFAVFDNIGTQVYTFPRIAIEAVHKTFPKRAAKYNTAEPAGLPDTPADVVTPQRHVRIAALVRDPMFRWIQALLLIPPILFTLPNGPGLVSITVFGNAIQVFVVPAMIIGLIWMTNNKKWMLKGWANKWWENLILLVIGGIGFWAAWGIAKNLPSQIGGLF